MLDTINESSRYLAPLLDGREHATGIILGTGLGDLADAITARHVIPYTAIPRFPASTVPGHAGRLLLGTLEGKNVIAMQGRLHYYEGYTMQEITLPVRVMRALGVTTLLVSNAAGGLNPGFRPGDLMIIDDHVNLFPEHPLRGHNHDTLGPRFPSMTAAYSPRLVAMAESIASRLTPSPEASTPRLHRGTYIGLQGPTFETPAESRWLRLIGGDAVGMSTVPEIIVARHAGMECFGLSVITNILPSSTTTHEEVQEAAHLARPRVTALLRALLRQL
jgi:purine-nucleoside phosphorylase